MHRSAISTAQQKTAAVIFRRREGILKGSRFTEGVTGNDVRTVPAASVGEEVSLRFAEELLLLLHSQETGYFIPIPEWRMSFALAGFRMSLATLRLHHAL